MIPPYSAFHSQTFSTNFSRPRSWRVLPSWARSFSTTFWTAMPAWSMPNTQRAFRPCMRRRRISTSWIEPFRAWPMCSAPVTFGGGMAMV
jgi:hypothetical protein